MSSDAWIQIATQALWLALLVSAAPVLAAAIVGLVVSLFQAATQLQEQTLTATPKIVAVYATLAVAGAWMLGELVRFAIVLLESIGRVGG